MPRHNAAERRIALAFPLGGDVDLGGTAQPVRASLLADLLARPVDRSRHPRAGLRLRRATITGRLDLRSADLATHVSFRDCTFTEPPDLAEARAVSVVFEDCALPGLRARLLDLRGDLVLRRCEVTGRVDLRDARIGGTLALDGSHLTGAAGDGHVTALAGARMTVAGNLDARQGFTADGELWLGGAKIGGNADLDGATLRGGSGPALSADRLAVAGSLTARHGFTAEGDVLLLHAEVGNQLNFMEATLRSAGAWALHLGGARVGSLWLTFAAPPVGRVRMSGLSADTIFDDPATWPDELDLVGCTYRLLISRSSAPRATQSRLKRVPVEQRLSWLRRSPDGYAPQPYEQLADLYRRSGQDTEARRVLLERQRRRRDTLPWPGRLFGYLLDGLIGYGYRTWLAGVWLAVFWALGTLTFTLQPSTARNPAEAPERNPALQALDLLLPIIDLGHDGAWKQTGVASYVAVLLVIAGWALTTAVVTGLARVFNR